MKTRFLSLALAVALALSMPFAALAADDGGVSAAAQKAVNYYASSEVTGWADVFALFAAGRDVSSYAGKLPEQGELTAIIWALASGTNPHTAYENIYSAMPPRQKSDGSIADGSGTVYINAHITAMLVLPHVLTGAYINLGKAEVWLISQQLPDGSFTYSGTDGDADLTAMALLALTDKTAADKAAGYLSKKMTANGGFISPWSTSGKENACSVAAVISGLAAQGMAIPEIMITNLLSFQLPDGSFCYESGGASDRFSTQQALTALGDVMNGGSYARLPGRYFRDEDSVSMGLAGHVNQAAAKGIVSGSDGYFRPADIMTRAEAARVIYDMLALKSTEGVVFTDVPPGAWYETAAKCAVAFGAMEAPGGVFGPGEKVSRLDFARYLCAALMLDKTSAMARYNAGTLKIADAASIPAEYLPAVAAVMNEGIFSGDASNNFMPSLYLTRDQLAALLNKLYA